MLITPSTFKDFLGVTKLLYQQGVLGEDYIREKELDPLKFGKSFLLHEVTSQLIKNSRTEAW